MQISACHWPKAGKLMKWHVHLIKQQTIQADLQAASLPARCDFLEVALISKPDRQQ